MMKKFEDIIKIEVLKKDDKPLDSTKGMSSTVPEVDPITKEHQRLIGHYENLAPQKVPMPHHFVPEIIRNKKLPAPDLMRMMKLSDHKHNESIKNTYDYSSVLEHPNFGKEHFDHYLEQTKGVDKEKNSALVNDLIYKIHTGRNSEHIGPHNASHIASLFRDSLPHLPHFLKNHGHHLDTPDIDSIVDNAAARKGHLYDEYQTLNTLHDHPKFNGAHIEKLLDSPYKNFAYNSHKIHPEVLDHAVNNIHEITANSSELGDAIGTNPNLTGDHAHKLVTKYLKDPEGVGRGVVEAAQAAIAHRNYHPEKLKEALSHPNIHDRMMDRFALDNPNINEDHLSTLISHKRGEDMSSTGKILRHHKANSDHHDQVWQAAGGKFENLPDSFYESRHAGKKHLDHLHSNIKDNSKGSSSLQNHLMRSLDNPNIEEHHVDKLVKHPAQHIRDRATEIGRINGFYEDENKINVSFGTTKLREARHLAAQKEDRRIHKKDLEKAGLNPKDLGISHLQDSKGHIHHDDLHEHISSLPTQQYGVSFSEYGDDESDFDERVEEAREAHSEDFNPSDWGIDKTSYVDESFARRHHYSQFDWDKHLDPDDFKDEEGNYDEQAHSDALEDAYSEHQDLFDIEDYVDHDDPNIFDRNRYEEDHSSSYESHMDRFSPSDHMGIDHDDIDEAYDVNLSNQQHNLHPSKVFQLNLTKDHMKRLKEAGVHETFKNMSQASYHSNHPGQYGNGVGWVRYTEKDDGMHIDEIQSDFGQSFLRQMQRELRNAVETGETTEEEASQIFEREKSKYPEDHLKKINDIIFNGRHSNEVLHEAFKQHLRNSGKEGTPLHMWQAKPKGEIAGMNTESELPAHMQFTYHQNPKKMGYKPSKYGAISTQDNPKLQGEDTWEHILKKARKALNNLNKTLGKKK